MSEEQALIGSKEICKFLRWKPDKLYHEAKFMKEAGALFLDCFGSPPHRVKRYYTFPSLLIRYLQEKRKNYEIPQNPKLKA